MLTAREVAIYALGKTEGVNFLVGVVLYWLIIFMLSFTSFWYLDLDQ